MQVNVNNTSSTVIPPVNPSNSSNCRHAQTYLDQLPTNNTKISLRAEYNPPAIVTSKKYNAITDSGATDNMTALPELFEEIIPLAHDNYVTLGDDSTKLQINGYGWINFTINNKRIRTVAYYVPALGTTLLSIKHHSKFIGNYFHSENNTSLLAYPNAVFVPESTSEMILQIAPAKNLTSPYVFDEEKAELVSSKLQNEYVQSIHLLNQAKAKPVITQEHQEQLAEKVFIKKIVNHAVLPVRSTEGAIGYDLTSSQDAIIKPFEPEDVHTGLEIEIPKGIYGRIAPRSGLSMKGLTVGGGVIDNDYQSKTGFSG